MKGDVLELSHAEKPNLGELLVEMRGITKRFPGVIANDDVNFGVKAGEIHALLGENGAGKSTLMNILYGIYQPDEGAIYVRGKKVTIRSPKDAIRLGIGMVHQHFMLIPSLTVTENIVLGLRTPKEPFLDLNWAEKKIESLSKQYGLKVDPKAKIWQLSVGEQQRVEILKALYRGVQVLILDEPTAVLTEQENKELIAILKKMANENLAIIPFITHKLREVMEVSDRVTVLRSGKVVATIETEHTDEVDLAKKMVGREVLYRLEKQYTENREVILEVRDLQALNDKGLPAVNKISLSLHGGEILGLAGVAGNGQRELTEVIMGMRKATGGNVFVLGSDMTNRRPDEIIEAGAGYVPEDRMGVGLIMDFTVAENLILASHGKEPFAYNWFLPFRKNWFLNREKISSYADQLISEFDIRTPSRDVPTRHLSGGNLQKIILARELSRNLKLLVAANPTRGLDVGATEDVRRILLSLRAKGAGVLLVSEDLDELMMISDRLAVIYEGQIVGTVQTKDARIEEIGQMMGGMQA